MLERIEYVLVCSIIFRLSYIALVFDLFVIKITVKGYSIFGLLDALDLES